MTRKRKRPFPCPYCKGRYSYDEFCIEGSCATTYCSGCTEGRIYVGSKEHQEIHINKIFTGLFSFIPWQHDVEQGYHENWGLERSVAERVSALIEEAVALAADENAWTQDDQCEACYAVLDRGNRENWDWVCSDECAITMSLREQVGEHGYYTHCIRARGKWDEPLLTKYLERGGTLGT